MGLGHIMFPMDISKKVPAKVSLKHVKKHGLSVAQTIYVLRVVLHVQFNAYVCDSLQFGK
jgi:hypothetical protein